MTSSWHHRPCYDIIGFPYIRRHAWPIGDLPHPGLRVHFSSEFDCRVFVHARIDKLMCPCFRSLLPSIVLDWVIIVRVHYALMPRNTPTRPVSVISNTLRTVCTGLWALFRLYKFKSSEAYCHWGDTSSSRMAHITYVYIWLFHLVSLCQLEVLGCCQCFPNMAIQYSSQ